MGPRSAVLGGRNCQIEHGGRMRAVTLGAAERCAGWMTLPNRVWRTRADGPIGGFGGAPYRATKRCIGW
eukprot:5728265-Pyramimonas_sp.AAC.1